MNNKDMEKIQSKYSKKRLSPLKSIKAYCKTMCCVSDLISWKECSFDKCFLYRYRLGQGNKALDKKHNSTQSLSNKNNVLQGDNNKQ